VPPRFSAIAHAALAFSAASIHALPASATKEGRVELDRAGWGATAVEAHTNSSAAAPSPSSAGRRL